MEKEKITNLLKKWSIIDYRSKYSFEELCDDIVFDIKDLTLDNVMYNYNSTIYNAEDDVHYYFSNSINIKFIFKNMFSFKIKYNGNEYQYYIYGEVLDRINYLRSKSSDFDNIITDYLTSMGFDKKNGFPTHSKQLSLLLDAGFDDIILVNRYKIENFVRDNLIETNKYIDEYIKSFLNGYSNSMDCSIILINENIIRKLLSITSDCINSKFSSKTYFYKMIEDISGEKITEDTNNVIVEINKVI